MWAAYALLAALLWGFDYAFAERVFKHVSILSFLAIQLTIGGLVLLGIALATGAFSRDMPTLFASRQTLTFLILGVIAFAVANVLICTAIQTKNATLSGLIEISYPIFIALISWVGFREHQLSAATAAGGVLIFAGVFVIYYFNR